MADGVVGDAEEAQGHRGRRSLLHRRAQGSAVPFPGGGPQGQGGSPRRRVPSRQEKAPPLRPLLSQERRRREPRQEVSVPPSRWISGLSFFSMPASLILDSLGQD